MNNAFTSYFIVIYDLLLYSWGIRGFLRECSHFFLVLGTWECSSVEHSTADREVGGSNPLAPFFIIIGYLSKDFRQLNIRLVLIVHYFELRRHMNHAFSSYFILIYDGVLYI